MNTLKNDFYLQLTQFIKLYVNLQMPIFEVIELLEAQIFILFFK